MSRFRWVITEVLTLLDQIDERCGMSMWTISVRGTIMSMAGMTEQKRAMILSLNEAAKGNTFLKAVIRRITERFDYGDVVSTETKFFEQKIKRQFEGETLHFLMYKLIPNNFDFEYDYQHIFNYEKNTSVIDIYQCLFDFICHSKLANKKLAYQDEAAWVVRVLNGLFNDRALKALAHSNGLDIKPNLNSAEYQLLDAYTSGKYSQLCEAMKKSQGLTRNFGLFEIWAKSACRNAVVFPENLLGKLLSAMTSVMLKDASYDAAQLFLASHTHAFSVIPWFRQLRYLSILESKFISSEKNSLLKKLSVAISQLYSPLKAKFLEDEAKEKYMDELRDRFPSSSSVALFNACTGASEIDISVQNLAQIDPLRMKKYRAEWFLERGRYSEAIEDLTCVIGNEDVAISNDATRLLVSAYIATNEIEKAVDTYVAAVIKNPSLLLTFDSHAICFAGESVISTSRSISLSIALSWHSKFFDDSYDAALKFSFECFLLNNEVEVPLDLLERVDIQRDHYHYFLEHVCIPEAMKLYLFFESTKDIELCRIDICKHLVQEHISVDAMIYEIKERTRRLVIMDAIKHVENSRIYSDTSSFNLPSASVEYRQLFDRFSNLRNQDYSAYEDEEALQKFFISAMKDTVLLNHLHIVHVQDLVLNEKNAIFMKLIKLMRDEFTFGVKGLNGHLSTRIRHGYFPNTLRKCLAEENLITAKLATSGTYKRNSYWVDSFSDQHRSKATEIERTFSEFASKFDNLINEVNDQWLKIGTLDQDISGLVDGKVKQTTLFNYSVTALETYYIQTKLAPNAEYSDLVKVVSTWLWERTEANLETIRNRLSTEVRERVQDLLKKLESDIYSILGTPELVSTFSDSISRARARFNTAFETIVGWFTRSQEQTIASFESDIPLEIAKLSAGVDVGFFEDTTYVKFSGKSLSYIVDILYVLLENCISKSNLPKEEINVSVRLFWEEQNFVLEVVNSCQLSEGKDLANQNLQHYRDNYGQEKYAVQASQGEGKSGFFKVWKALSKDLELPHSTSFEFVTDTQFRVAVRVDRDELKKILS